MTTIRRAAALGSAGGLVLAAAMAVVPPTQYAQATGTTTAWQSGQFHLDTPNVVRRSDIVLGRPNTAQSQFMPLGNGTLGAAVWAAGGFTAQLNRSDTLPDRKSPGWLTIPGLSKLTSAPDFAAHLDLYDGTLVESGGGMTATVYVRADKDELVVDVTGANPSTQQTAQLALWSGRSPQTAASGSIATLGETWTDSTEPGHTGNTYGSLGAVTAGGQNVTAAVVDSKTVKVSFTPRSDGSFRVIAAAPHWAGGDAQSTASGLLGSDATAACATLESAHLSWWHTFWGGVGLIRYSSSDGSADYLESLRTLDLYDAAAESRDTYPGSQAGVADLFSPYQDSHMWDPGAYWHWNLRMQVQANIDAGAFSLNDPYFRLYSNNLSAIENWTTAHMNNRAGICVPETMRFNGVGYEYETWLSTTPVLCDSATAAYYNSRTVSTGAEVGLWVWQQYQTSGDRTFLAANYPLMSQAARFLLAYATTGSDGYLHTYPSNAHETQWDVHDPTTDLAAMQALFPATVQAAQTLGQDADLVTQLQAAIPKIRPYARTDTATQSQLLTASDDASGNDMIAPSYDPSANKHGGTENIGLEPVWPYGLVGDSGALTALAQRTYSNRPNKDVDDWSSDPIQAARLGLGSEVAATLTAITEKYQTLPSGLATFVGSEPYGEQQGVASAALSEALVQDYDGLLRVAPRSPRAGTPTEPSSSTAAARSPSRSTAAPSPPSVSTPAPPAASTSATPGPASRSRSSTAPTRARSSSPPPPPPPSPSPSPAASPTSCRRSRTPSAARPTPP